MIELRCARCGMSHLMTAANADGCTADGMLLTCNICMGNLVDVARTPLEVDDAGILVQQHADTDRSAEIVAALRARVVLGRQLAAELARLAADVLEQPVPDVVDVDGVFDLRMTLAGTRGLLEVLRDVLADTPHEATDAELLALAEAEMHQGPACRVCGCTELDACDDGCGWVEVDLCSSCVEDSADE